MRLKFILALMIVMVALWSTVLPVAAQATNFLASVGCDAVAISGTAGTTGTVTVTAVAGATTILTGATTGATAGSTFSATFTFTAAQVVGTAITVTTTLGTFTDVRTISCTGPLGGGGDGRLNDLSAPIAVYCANGGVTIINIVNGQGVSSVNANGGQIANGLAQAGSTRTNTQIVGSGTTSLWALSSGELQAVFRGFSNYDFIFLPTRCGIIFSGTTVISVTATPIGTVYPPIIYGPIYTPPTSVTPVASSGTCVAPAGAHGVHIVSAGENLFRIGLRYGIDYRVLAAYNGIANPARIYVGQCIIIP
ncbi:MAG: LysM domain-containing protein [Anaerolineae bacterium]